MDRPPLPTWYFVVVVVACEGRYLLIQEPRYHPRWYLPAGRVEPGETLMAAARREMLEETGLTVTLRSILRLEHTPFADGTARLRVIFTGDVFPPSLTPFHPPAGGLGQWFLPEETDSLPLRAPDLPGILCQARDNLPSAADLSLLMREN